MPKIVIHFELPDSFFEAMRELLDLPEIESTEEDAQQASAKGKSAPQGAQ
jgi:hypothetical protein